jgi:hypothetical protein
MIFFECLLMGMKRTGKRPMGFVVLAFNTLTSTTLELRLLLFAIVNPSQWAANTILRGLTLIDIFGTDI